MVSAHTPVVLVDLLGSSMTLLMDGARPRERLLRERPHIDRLPDPLARFWSLVDFEKVLELLMEWDL